jgi:hypothetical protein
MAARRRKTGRGRTGLPGAAGGRARAAVASAPKDERPGLPPAGEFVSGLSPAHVASLAWALKHPRELAEHAGRWVVVADGAIRSSGSTESEAISASERAGYSKRDIAVHFVEEPDVTYGQRLS